MRRWVVVFDLDGLLVDSEPVQQESFNLVLARYGIRLDDEEFRPLVGRSTRENFAFLKERYRIGESIADLLARADPADHGISSSTSGNWDDRRSSTGRVSDGPQ